MAGRGRTYRGRAIGHAGSAELALNLRGIKNWNLTDLLPSNLLGGQELQNPQGPMDSVVFNRLTAEDPPNSFPPKRSRKLASL
jgi:hypothetical protein